MKIMCNININSNNEIIIMILFNIMKESINVLILILMKLM